MFKVTLGLVAILLAVGAYLLATPQIAIDSPFFLFLLFAPVVAIYLVYAIRRSSWRAATPAFALMGFFVALMVASSGMFRASSYHALLGEEKTADFKTSLPVLDLENAPLVSYDMAMRAAEKKLAEIPALGSQAKVSHLEKQLVNGKLLWVGFLEHRGFFTWWSTSTTPGYVKVSATDPSDVQLVTELNGRKLALRYLRSAYLGDEVYRHIRLNGYATEGVADIAPEIDDEGRPYQVITVFKRRVGFAGRDATGVILLDAQTGKSTYYDIDKTPKWVDRIQPEGVVQSQLADRLEYVHGWFNPSHTDMLALSGELDLVYGHDGSAHFFGGLGSTAKEGGLVGFVLINSRTKEVLRYNLVGVTEQVAKHAAEGLLSEKRYTATNALPFMVEGVPTYVMALRDATGIARAYAMVDITDYQKVATGETLAATLRNYQGKRNQDRLSVDAAPRADEAKLTARVARIGVDVRGGASTYVFTLEGQGRRLFTADTNRSDELPVTHAGDLVQIRAVLEATHGTSPVLEFKNLTIESLPVAPATTASSVTK